MFSPLNVKIKVLWKKCFVGNNIPVMLSSMIVTTPWQLIRLKAKLFIVCVCVRMACSNITLASTNSALGKIKWQYSGSMYFHTLWLAIAQNGKKWGTNKQTKQNKKKSFHSCHSFFHSPAGFGPKLTLYYAPGPNAFWFFQKAEASRVPKGERSIPAQCGKLLNGGSVAAKSPWLPNFAASLKGPTRAIFCSINTSFIFRCAETTSFGLGVTKHISCKKKKKKTEPEKDWVR